MIELFKDLSQEDANSYGLVLSSSGIPHHVREGEGGWDVWVDDWDYEKALNTIERYLEENQAFAQTDEPNGGEYGKTFTGLWASALLLACHVAVATSNDSKALISSYGSSASHILQGDFYRTVSSLMLHANALHLAGNMLGIALFGTAICTVTGWGVGWLMILVTGIVGNLANAVLYRTGHLSIGASTAVFGAIGILAAQQFLKNLGLPGRRIKPWLPLGGGLALLGILGSGEHTDLMAHLFGFVTGIGLGAMYTVSVKQPATRTYQVCCLVIVLLVLVVSWMKVPRSG